MTVLRSAFDPVVLSRTPSWSRKGMVFKGYHYPNSPRQRLVRAAFMETAAEAFGKEGPMAVARYVAANIHNHGLPNPGAAAQQAENRRQERHASVPGRVQTLRASVRGEGIRTRRAPAMASAAYDWE
jgi:hypothetical protein